MAKTKSSVHPTQQKKIVVVDGYRRKDGVRVGPHRRSTPNWQEMAPSLVPFPFLHFAMN